MLNVFSTSQAALASPARLALGPHLVRQALGQAARQALELPALQALARPVLRPSGQLLLQRPASSGPLAHQLLPARQPQPARPPSQG